MIRITSKKIAATYDFFFQQYYIFYIDFNRCYIYTERRLTSRLQSKDAKGEKGTSSPATSSEETNGMPMVIFI